MTKQDASEQPASADHLTNCLSMVMHHEEVHMMVNVIERILADQTQASEAPEEM